MSWSDLTGQTKAAAILAILGFVVAITFTQTSVINGVASCSHMNYGALGFGVLAVIVGASGVFGASGAQRGANLAICGIAVVLGGINVLRGIGMIGGPC